MGKVILLVLLFFAGYAFWKFIRRLWRNADIDEQKENVETKEDQYSDVQSFAKSHRVPKGFKDRMARFFE
jgi:hypothetical protein